MKGSTVEGIVGLGPEPPGCDKADNDFFNIVVRLEYPDQGVIQVYDYLTI